MSYDTPDVDIDNILMPPPRKRPRGGMESSFLAKDITFSLPMSSSQNVLPMPSIDDSRINPELDSSANMPIITATSQNDDHVACLPEAVSFVTPPKTESCFHQTTTTVEDRDMTIFSESDSIQTERSNVIDESYSVSNENQEQGHEDPQPETTSTRFSDIIGHASVKLRIDEMLLPLALPPTLAQSILTGVRSMPASLLLYGPPGCGKTQLARAIAGEARAAFISVGPSDILSKFVGESEASVRSIFRKAYDDAKKMESLCTVLFFDEIDALGHSRGPSELGAQNSESEGGCSRRVLAELLIQLTLLQSTAKDDEIYSLASQEQGENYPIMCTPDDVAQAPSSKVGNSSLEIDDEGNVNREQQKARVIVVAATNRPEDCDPALLRRFSIRVNVGLPTCRDRRKIISKFLSELDHTITKTQLKEMALSTEGWSGCDLESLAREAAMAPIRECLRSAAMLKRRSRKMEQQGGDELRQELKRKSVDADEEARETLLRDFRQLRPVSLEDFEDAFEFWLGDQQTTSIAGAIQPKRKQVHYDSESSSDSEED